MRSRAYLITLAEDHNGLLTNSEVRLMLLWNTYNCKLSMSSSPPCLISKNMCERDWKIFNWTTARCSYTAHALHKYVVCIWSLLGICSRGALNTICWLFALFNVWGKGRLWHFMFVQEHSMSTLKNKKSHRILNKQI